MGERGDVIRTMQRALSARGHGSAAAEQVIYEPQAVDSRALIGRVIERGLSDELNDRHYLIVEAIDGRVNYIHIGRSDFADAPAAGSIVRIEPVRLGVREADRTVVAIAEANGGRYDVDLHLNYDPTATQAFAEAHVRRLEAIRRWGGGVEREPDGTWRIAPNHLQQAAAFEAARAKDRPVAVEILSSEPLEKLIEADAATWLDRELVAATPEPLRDAGFGHDVAAAQAARRQWLIAQELAEEQSGETRYRSNLLEVLRRRELLRVADQLSEKLTMPFAETEPSEHIQGILRQRLDLISGRFALVERSRDFTLVPWRPVLERRIGKEVSGILREGGVSWTIGRGRSGPSIS
jgi:hypothetical protein